MTQWDHRPLEEARLFNPAFMLTLLAGATADYESVAEEGMPWLLAFLVPPLALAERTRDALPSSTHAHFANWISAHPDIRFEFGARARSLTALTQEALRLGVRTGVLEFDGPRLRARSRPGKAQLTSAEVTECVKASRLIGRWFASRHGTTTIYGLLGVMP
jgi:hypothetical protein